MKLVATVLVFLLGVVSVMSTSGLSDDEKTEVLNAHNYYRGLVDPVASNMQRMYWDEELGYMAQFWAAGCIYEINENRHTQSTKFDYVGENKLALSGYSANYTLLVNRWFKIGQSYDHYTGYCRDEDGNQEQCEDEMDCICAPYVQLVWAQTYAVGCGVSRCTELEGAEDDGENALYFVCYYGPGGSIVSGEPPYDKGDVSCSSCPTDKPYCDRNLCSESGAERVVVHLSVISVLMAAVLSIF
ncbi:peptidase inhibitor 16-like [Halichondria panicea]|uniref:peptidase inhibitor 16-like n=1 Tax=Halichondria panicea TaxID=6063 RepID=UPI00312B55BF